MNTVRIAIAEDNTLALKSIKNKLSAYNNIKIEFHSFNGRDLIYQLSKNEVDLILMDIEMPVMDGITATAEIKQIYPLVKILMLTTFDDDDKIFNAILAGASGYILKDEKAENVYNFIISALEGGGSMSSVIALKAIQYIRNTMKSGKETAEENILSGRETEILMEIKNGLTYREIAKRLNISEGTVRKHIENIYEKLQVNNKIGALNVAKEKRWI